MYLLHLLFMYPRTLAFQVWGYLLRLFVNWKSVRRRQERKTRVQIEIYEENEAIPCIDSVPGIQAEVVAVLRAGSPSLSSVFTHQNKNLIPNAKAFSTLPTYTF